MNLGNPVTINLYSSLIQSNPFEDSYEPPKISFLQPYSLGINPVGNSITIAPPSGIFLEFCIDI